VYQVTGNTSSADITYVSSDSGKTSYVTGASVPTSETVQLRTGTTFQISAIDSDPAGSSVICVVLDNGQQIQQNTANGPYATASCQGTVT